MFSMSGVVSLTKLPQVPVPSFMFWAILGMSWDLAPSWVKLIGIPIEVRKFSSLDMPSRAVVSGLAKSIWQPQTLTAN